MLQSERVERKRRFKLALRASIPTLLLIALLSCIIFFTKILSNPLLESVLLLGALLFISIYFIYFILEMDSRKTLDQSTLSYNYETFLILLKKKKPRALAILLVNNFSTINENYGTIDSNGVLRTLVFKLDYLLQSHMIEKESLIGRHFGAEFLIAADHDSDTLRKILETFVMENQTLNGIEVDYRFSVIDYDGTEPKEIVTLLRDFLLSQKNSSNKAGIEIINANELTTLEEATIIALENEALDLCFHPLLHTREKQVDSYKITVKLETKEGKKILPEYYLPIINRLGLGCSYDLLAFKHIVKIALQTDERISFSFSLSPFSLRNRDFLTELFAVVEEEGIDTRRLVIQLYERKTHYRLDSYLKILRKIREKGFQICIDNVGSCNASIEYMKHFKFDRIQFDRDFIGRLDDQKSTSLLKSLIDMSRELEIETIAKGVDTDPQKERLIDLGIDYLQGLDIGKLLTEKELLEQYHTPKERK